MENKLGTARKCVVNPCRKRICGKLKKSWRIFAPDEFSYEDALIWFLNGQKSCGAKIRRFGAKIRQSFRLKSNL